MARAWLFAESQGTAIQGQFKIVFNREEAAEMTNGDAQQIMRAAENGHPNYRWELIGIGNNLFIVEGTIK